MSATFGDHILTVWLKIMLFALILGSCETSHDTDLSEQNKFTTSTQLENITDFKRGDIIVKPNINLLPGSAIISEGFNFGHAALVIKGFTHENIDSLLAGTIIVESIAKDVPQAFQIREVAALSHHRMPAFNNTNFDHRSKGHRYRLRLSLSESQIDSIIAFAMRQKGDFSSWNATKGTPPPSIDLNDKSWADNSHWYCSLLVWQSVLAATGIDLDPNGGYMVYPNDLISSPYFDNDSISIGRVRF